MSWEQRNADFCKAQTDAQMAYIEAEREVDRLRAENAELQEQVANLTDRSFRMADKMDCLNAENDELRGLVRELWEGYNDPRCEECHLRDTPTCADCPICAREASVIDRMRELGVEVDE